MIKAGRTIQIKAAFLFTVFALNIVIGFACAVGVNMRFNLQHQHEETKDIVHTHKDGSKHVHHEKKHGHDNEPIHHEEKAVKKDAESEKDHCCNKKVTEIDQLDKAIPPVISLTHPLVFSVFTNHYQLVLLPYKDVVKDPKPFVRGHHPPIPDIRIAIQSFLI